MVMGRKSMDVLAGMNLGADEWPYGKTHIVVLSNTVKRAPENLQAKVEVFSGEISDLMKDLKHQGVSHIKVDGGATITSFLNHKLIDQITITKATEARSPY